MHTRATPPFRNTPSWCFSRWPWTSEHVSTALNGGTIERHREPEDVRHPPRIRQGLVACTILFLLRGFSKFLCVFLFFECLLKIYRIFSSLLFFCTLFERFCKIYWIFWSDIASTEVGFWSRLLRKLASVSTDSLHSRCKCIGFSEDFSFAEIRRTILKDILDFLTGFSFNASWLFTLRRFSSVCADSLDACSQYLRSRLHFSFAQILRTLVANTLVSYWI